MDNNILRELKFIPQKGGLFFKDVRYLLIRPETLAFFQKGIEKQLGEKVSAILYQGGFQGGSLSSKKYREVFGLSDEQIVHFMIEMGPQIGWGKFELETFNSREKLLIVKVYSSPFAEAYGPSPLPVCHLIRGVLNGMASIVFKKDVEAKELYCLAMGYECCKFEIR